MSIYQVMQRPTGQYDSVTGSEAVFIKDQFSWTAALLPPVWAIMHGLWLELVFVVSIIILLTFTSAIIGEEAVGWIYCVGVVLLGFEAGNIRAAALARNNYNVGGYMVAGSEDIAEMHWIKSRSNA